MKTVTSKDGAKIAFDKTGADPAIIIVNGTLQYRAFDPTMAQIDDMLSKHFTVYNYNALKSLSCDIPGNRVFAHLPRLGLRKNSMSGRVLYFK